MKELIIIAFLTLIVLSEARPSDNLVDTKASLKTGGHARVRRRFNYDDYMDKFWDELDKNENSNMLNIGNGYKNKNTVHISGKRHGYGMVNIGNGSKNTNTVYYGVKPINGDPFDDPFFKH
ncbi:uncharacterized protein LOC112056632 [Bicyclus anynana]|uniref:Uncharacterized protein LOC112056632 n=1 Tax=Bicyclus anynana TaxID=110368 RepID=A0A6J1P4W1_BICAN|nr:uncharacterized protein LOC112056632 [Bicyclus anynana]